MSKQLIHGGLKLSLLILLAGCAGRHLQQEEADPVAEGAGEALATAAWQELAPLRLTESSSDQVAPRFFATGRELIYQSNSDGNWELYTLQVDDLRPQRVTDTPDAEEDPSVSPDGRWILCTVHPPSLSGNPPRDILIMGRDGKNRRRIAQHGADDWAPRFSADGMSVWFMSDRLDERGDVPDYERQSALFQFDLVTEVLEQVEGPGALSAPCLTADGTALCSDSKRIAWATGAAGTAELPAEVASDWHLGQTTWHGEHGWLASGMPDLAGSRLILWNAAGSRWDELPTPGLEEARGPVYSPDGDSFAFYGRSDGQWDLYLWKLR